LARTRELVATKYGLESWNIGKSPPGDVTLKRRFPVGTLELHLSVAKNRIVAAKLTGDFLAGGDLPWETTPERLAEALIGLPANRQEDWARVWGDFDLNGAFRGQVDAEAVLGWLGGAWSP
jgi:lipoate-protein ligase A